MRREHAHLALQISASSLPNASDEASGLPHCLVIDMSGSHVVHQVNEPVTGGGFGVSTVAGFGPVASVNPPRPVAVRAVR